MPPETDLEIDNMVNEIIPETLKISSYNVHGLFDKINHPHFFELIAEFDVFFCLETHIFESNKQAQVKQYFPNFNLHSELATRVATRGRGMSGILVGWKKDLMKRLGIVVELERIEYFTFLNIKKGTEIIKVLPLYVRSEDWTNDLRNLRQYLVEYGTQNLIIMGDLNVRIGELQQEFVEEIHGGSNALSHRKSEDKKDNRKGKEWFDLCNDHNLWILNGAFRGDKEGKFTYCTVMGNSVNDIAAVSNSILNKVDEFTVKNAIWSDHFPIQVSMSVDSCRMPSEGMKLLPKLLWRKNQQTHYCNKLNRCLEEFQNDPNVEQLCEIVKKSAPITFKSTTNFTKKQKWFDRDCENARKTSFKKLSEWRREEHHSVKNRKKREYLSSNISYNRLLKQKKESYHRELRIKLNTVQGSKHWWALVKEYNNKPFTVGSNVQAEDFKLYFKELLNLETSQSEYSFAFPLIEDELLDGDITCEEVVAALTKLKDNKAPGEDRISYEFFKYASTEFHKALAKAFTCVLNYGNADAIFFKNIIFPIFKKGDPNIPNNYRGITFMNCAAKVLMAILNNRLMNWIQQMNILYEYQAGFRPKYSTVDNVYNLCSVIQLKFSEKKKVYAFFVDFKAAFDRVPRTALMYKLSCMGVSTKFLNLLKSLYTGTMSAVWNGSDLSEYFETLSGVKQGCILSPTLFALFLNDLHDVLGGGLHVDEINLRVLLYADDIVILADNPNTLQAMIENLEKYCLEWNMSINMDKSKILVFRRGGRLGRNEKWFLNGLPVQTVESYVYLGVKFTSKMSFTKHIEERSNKAKTSMYGSWEKLLRDESIDINLKFSIFKAVMRGIQCYSSQVFGYKYEDQINKLQVHFIKLILRLPEKTPTYALFLETDETPSSMYTLKLHMEYIKKTLFVYEDFRLPHILSLKILQKRIYWFDDWCKMSNVTLVRWQDLPFIEERWSYCIKSAIENYRVSFYNQCVQKKMSSEYRFYRNLDHRVEYIGTLSRLSDISLIAKARCDVLGLNGNRFDENADKRCSLCNLDAEENIKHFLGECPIFAEFRIRAFERSCLNNEDVMDMLNGSNFSWASLIWFLKIALAYRRELILEFNY